MNKPTDKQLSMIGYHCRGESGKLLLDKLPKNNEKYPDERANYSGQILLEFIEENLTRQEASAVISKMIDYDFISAERTLKNKGLKI
jgi:hypothetical protein